MRVCLAGPRDVWLCRNDLRREVLRHFSGVGGGGGEFCRVGTALFHVTQSILTAICIDKSTQEERKFVPSMQASTVKLKDCILIVKNLEFLCVTGCSSAYIKVGMTMGKPVGFITQPVRAPAVGQYLHWTVWVQVKPLVGAL